MQRHHYFIKLLPEEQSKYPEKLEELPQFLGSVCVDGNSISQNIFFLVLLINILQINAYKITNIRLLPSAKTIINMYQKGLALPFSVCIE